jgi:ligand-binding sensor domain-containing protein
MSASRHLRAAAALHVIASFGCAAPAEPREAEPQEPAPELAAAPSGPSIATRTLDVAGLAIDEAALWVATRGGLERYAAPDFRARRLYGTADGLDSMDVRAVFSDERGLEVQTRGSRCRLEGERFACSPRAAPPPLPPLALPPIAGRRVTASLSARGRHFVGTAGAGVWELGSEERRLSPAGQLCGHHVTSFALHQGELFVGTFNEGLCRTHDGTSFAPVEAPFAMVNHLLSTPIGLFVAASEGLYRLGDDGRFVALQGLEVRGASRLAFDGKALYATSPAALWRFDPDATPRMRSWQAPAGSGALQAVSFSGGELWLASEDRGAIHFDGESFRSFDAASGLPTSWMLDVAADDDGSAYLATLRHGVVHVKRDGSWSRIEGVPDAWILRLALDDDALLVGTQNGATRNAAPLTGLPDPRVHAFARAWGKLFVGTEGGLAIY